MLLFLQHLTHIRDEKEFIIWAIKFALKYSKLFEAFVVRKIYEPREEMRIWIVLRNFVKMLADALGLTQHPLVEEVEQLLLEYYRDPTKPRKPKSLEDLFNLSAGAFYTVLRAHGAILKPRSLSLLFIGTEDKAFSDALVEWQHELQQYLQIKEPPNPGLTFELMKKLLIQVMPYLRHLDPDHVKGELQYLWDKYFLLAKRDTPGVTSSIFVALLYLACVFVIDEYRKKGIFVPYPKQKDILKALATSSRTFRQYVKALIKHLPPDKQKLLKKLLRRGVRPQKIK